MRRLPILPTLVVAVAVAVMIGLGFWQLQRAEWKDRLLAGYAAAESMPAVDLDPLLARGLDDEETARLAFRRALVSCNSRSAEPELRGGRNEAGAGGYAYFLPCRPGAAGPAGRLWVNAGWQAMPDDELRLSLPPLVAGRLGATDGDRIVLTSATASPPLRAAVAPGPAERSNNHLFYAWQWFFFAAAAAAIYWLALRRRGGETLPPPPGHPKSGD